MKKRTKIILGILVGVWVFAMAMTAPEMSEALHQRKFVEQTFNTYSKALVDNKLEQAYGYCGTEFQRATPFSDFVAIQQTLQTRFGTLKAIRQTSMVVKVQRSPHLEIASVQASLEYQRETLKILYELHFENGRWAIFGFKQI